jgi:hypothetical protein
MILGFFILSLMVEEKPQPTQQNQPVLEGFLYVTPKQWYVWLSGARYTQLQSIDTQWTLVDVKDDQVMVQNEAGKKFNLLN